MQILAVLVVGLFLTLSVFITGTRFIEEKLSFPPPSITTTPSPTEKPTTGPTYGPQVKGTQVDQTPIPTAEVDPIVTCQFKHIPVRQMRLGECKKSTECQLFQGGEWFFSPSVEECKQKQLTYQHRSSSTSTQPTNTLEVPESGQVINCIAPPECGSKNYTLLKSACDQYVCCQTNTGSYFVDRETCEYFQEVDADLFKDPSNQIIDCLVPLQCGGGSYRWLKGECDKYVCCQTPTGAYFVYRETCEDMLKGNANRPTGRPEQQTGGEINDCKNKVNSRYNDLVNNCSIQFEGSGVEACERAVNNEREKELRKCEGN